MSLLAILAVVYGLKEIAQDGISALSIGAIVLGVVIGTLFVRRQLSLESPIIDVRLFRIRAFSASLGTYFLGIFVVVGYFLLVAQYLQLVLGLSPFTAALWSLPSAVGFIVGSVTAPRVIHRFRPSIIMGGGLGIASIGSILLLRTSTDADASLPIIALASVIMSLGFAPVITLATELIVGSAPPEQAGAATGVSETSGELGGALGIAILGSLGAAIYRSELADTIPPEVPADVADAALDTLGGALAIAATLPEAVGSALATAAQVALIDSLHIVAAVSAVGAIATAIIAAVALWPVPARAEPAAGEEMTSTPSVVPD